MVAGFRVGDTVRFDMTAAGMSVEDWEMEPGDPFGQFIARCHGLLGEVVEVDDLDPEFVSVHFQDGEIIDDVHIQHFEAVEGVKVLSPRIAA